MGHPVRWASTDSSAHRVIPGWRSAARWPVRMSRKVHGLAWQSAPQVMLRTVATVTGLTVGPRVASRAVPSVIRASTG